MSLSNKIACATQCNYRLNRRILRMKHSWDEVDNILSAACCRRKSNCHASPPPPPPPRPAPPPKPSCSFPDLCCLLNACSPPKQEPCHHPRPEQEHHPEKGLCHHPEQDQCHRPDREQEHRPEQETCSPHRSRRPGQNSPFYPFF